MPGHVFKRGNVWWISFYYQGRKLRHSANTTRKKEAENLLTHFLAQVSRGDFVGFEQPQSLTLGDVLTLVLQEAETKKRRDVYHMRFRAKHLTTILGASTPVGHITEMAIARYVAKRHSQGKQSSTINRELAVLRAALKQAKKHKAIKEVPEIERYPEENTRMVFFDTEDFTQILDHLPDVIRDIALFAYHTGWRKGQIVNLQWRDVQGQVIRLSGATVKTKSVQVLALVGELAAIIERRRAVQNGPWVFHRNGRPVKDFRGAWDKALEEAEVTGYTFHDFRRTATRNMALAGVPEKHIMQVTGHKTTAMLQRYNITVEQDTYNTLLRTQEFLQRAQSSHREQNGEKGEKSDGTLTL